MFLGWAYEYCIKSDMDVYEKEPEKQVFVQQGEKILEAVRKGEDGG